MQQPMQHTKPARGRTIPAASVRRFAATIGALVTAGALFVAGNAPRAAAQPAAEPPPPPVDPRVPSSVPAEASFSDGWTMRISATDETQLPLPPMTPAKGSRDVIVGGTFRGELRSGTSSITPSGTIEVGYQVGCDSPDNFIFSMLGQVKSGETNRSVLSQEFSGTSPTVEVAGYRLHIDQCAGPAFVRSYAVLTRSGTDSGSAVYYYGVPSSV